MTGCLLSMTWTERPAAHTLEDGRSCETSTHQIRLITRRIRSRRSRAFRQERHYEEWKDTKDGSQSLRPREHPEEGKKTEVLLSLRTEFFSLAYDSWLLRDAKPITERYCHANTAAL